MAVRCFSFWFKFILTLHLQDDKEFDIMPVMKNVKKWNSQWSPVQIQGKPDSEKTLFFFFFLFFISYMTCTMYSVLSSHSTLGLGVPNFILKINKIHSIDQGKPRSMQQLSKFYWVFTFNQVGNTSLIPRYFR